MAQRPAVSAPRESVALAKELWIALLVFAFAVLYLWPLRDFVSFNADEGIVLAMAERIAHGQVAYRDFFSFVTPASPYLMALWFKLFGSSYAGARSILLLYGGAFGAATYLLARRASSRPAALWAASILVFGCMPSRFFVLHNWDSTFFALLAVCCAHALLRPASAAWPFLLGSATAMTFLSEQSKGAGLVLGLALAAVALRATRAGGDARLSWRKLPSGLLGFAAPLAIAFAYFASQHALRPMLDDCLWPLRHYSRANRISLGALPITPEDLTDLFSSSSPGVRAFIVLFGAPALIISALALLVVGATFAAIVARGKRGPSPARDTTVLGGCIFSGVFLSVLATRRADLNHILYLAPLFLYLVPSIFELGPRGVRLFGNIRPVIAAVLAIAFAGFGFISLSKAASAKTIMPTARGEVRVAAPDEVLAYLRSNIPEGAHLYLHPYQTLYSFLSGTINSTHMVYLQPGMNTAAQYGEVLADLTADQTPYVLLNPDFGDKIATTWPSTPAEALAQDPVEAYILRHYRTCRVLNAAPEHNWRFYLMVREDLRCPA
jgi:hypothetical protein